ncbi:histidine kinase [Mucilaginibacter sp. 21P]|uniref:sensor histidine kinase n=1 Tax=Mucilaginibacter sp. 21P TaxID=2778902 RepID=UPI001C58AB90|nr:histidine kinase [Mucilaginibacter sp. 21P]QXV63743.1 histidine kinase [Mucilaginibacter sp. 21P]
MKMSVRRRSSLTGLSTFRLRHLWWWAALLLYEQSIVFAAHQQLDIGKTVLYYLINIGLFYTHVSLLNAFHGDLQQPLRLTVYVLVEIVFFLMLKSLVDQLLTSDPHWAGQDFIELMALNIYRIVFFMGLATLFWAASSLSDYERKMTASEIAGLEAEKKALLLESKLAIAENALLRQQVNPHLLFNVLNFIHTTIHRRSRKSAEMIILLTDTLRFSLESGSPERKVAVSDEIEQLRNLIKIHDIRSGIPNQVVLSVSGPIGEFQMIPLVLITLVENIYKHGDQSISKACIDIKLSASGELSFFSKNACKRSSPFARLKSTGLINLRHRLEHFYQDRFLLITDSNGDHFETRLTIQL